MRLEALADSWGASVLWDHPVSVSVGVMVSAGHQGASRLVAAAVACVGEGVLGASAGWDGVGRVEIQGAPVGKMGLLVDVHSEEA